MSVNLKTFFREMLVVIILKIFKMVVDQLDPDGDGEVGVVGEEA